MRGIFTNKSNADALLLVHIYKAQHRNLVLWKKNWFKVLIIRNVFQDTSLQFRKQDHLWTKLKTNRSTIGDVGGWVAHMWREET